MPVRRPCRPAFRPGAGDGSGPPGGTRAPPTRTPVGRAGSVPPRPTGRASPSGRGHGPVSPFDTGSIGPPRRSGEVDPGQPRGPPPGHREAAARGPPRGANGAGPAAGHPVRRRRAESTVAVVDQRRAGVVHVPMLPVARHGPLGRPPACTGSPPGAPYPATVPGWDAATGPRSHSLKPCRCPNAPASMTTSPSSATTNVPTSKRSGR